MKHRLHSFRVVALVSLILVGYTAALPGHAAQGDPQGCPGLTGYMVDLHALTDELYAEFGKEEATWTPRSDGETDEATDDSPGLSLDDPVKIGGAFQAYADGLNAIDPPDWLTAWHTLRIANAQTLADMFEEAQSTGLLLATQTFTGRITAIQSDMAAAQAMVVKQCRSFLDMLHEHDAFGDQVDPRRLLDGAGTSPGAATPETETSGAAQSVRLHNTGTVGGEWAVEVMAVIKDPYQIDPQATWFTDWLDRNPPPTGEQFFTVRVRITNRSAHAEAPLHALRLGLVTDVSFVYDGMAACGSVPGQLSYSTQLRPGESVEANLCWVVVRRDIASLRLYGEPASSFDESERVLFDLV